MIPTRAPARPAPPPHRTHSALRVSVRAGVPPQAQRLEHAGRLGEALLRARPELDRCTLVVNNNARRVLSWRVEGSHLELSVHHTVLPCSEDIVLVALHGDDGAWGRLRRRFTEHAPARPTRSAAVDPRGQHHQLDVLAARVRAAWPTLPVEVPVGWGRMPARLPRSTVRLGSCGGQPTVVRIHPVLDNPDVPPWFIEFVLYHELLHALLPPQRVGDRRIIHSAEFRALERAHPDHTRALGWERSQLGVLLRQLARRGRRAAPG